MGISLLFVYGTLKRNQPNHKVIEKLPFVSTAKTVDEWGFVSLEKFPGMLKDATWRIQVEGELFALGDKWFDRLDRFEGVPGLYTRAGIWVELPNGVLKTAWAYFLNPAHAKDARPITTWPPYQYNQYQHQHQHQPWVGASRGENGSLYYD